MAIKAELTAHELTGGRRIFDEVFDIEDCLYVRACCNEHQLNLSASKS